ncbi:ABC transporter permease [Caldicellulosiruptoraceae bacterium PP1]
MLNKIPKRLILKNKSQYLGISLLILIGCMCYTMFAVTMGNISNNYEIFKEKTNQEKAHFIIMGDLDKAFIKKNFNVNIEKRLQSDYDFSGKTLRLFSLPNEINKPFVQEGRTIKNNNEILIDPNFANKNGYRIGESIKLNNKSYKIVGFFVMPDYTYVIKNEQDILNDPVHFGIAMMYESELKSNFKVPVYSYYMAVGNEKNIDKLKNYIAENTTLLDFKYKNENARILYSEMKIKSGEKATLPIAVFIILLSSFLLFIVLRRQINILHSEIGALYSLGYTKKELLSVYMRIPIYIWLFGSIFGTILGYVEAIPMTNMYRSYFSIPVVELSYPVKEIIVSILLPFIFIIPSGFLALNKMLSKSIIEIIRGTSKFSFKKIKLKFFDKFSFKSRIMFKHGLIHISRELILIIGIASSTVLMLYGLIAQSSIENITNFTYKEVLKYNYQYILNGYYTKSDLNINNQNYEPFVVVSFEINNTKTNVQLYGINKKTEFIKFPNQDIDFSGLVIAKSLAIKFNLNKGDIITLHDKFRDKDYKIKISDIAPIYIGSQGFMDINQLIEKFGLKQGYYNGIFSFDSLNIPSDKLFMSFDKQYLINSFKDLSKPMQAVIGVMSLMASLLSLIIIYVLSSLTINESRKNISLFKLLGFYNNEVDYMTLGLNNISFVIGFILGLPFFRILSDALIAYATKDSDFSIDLSLKLSSVLIGFIALLAVYILSRYLGRLKINKIEPVEILKEQMD